MQINVVLGHLLSGLMLSFCLGGHLLLNLVILLIYFLAFSNPGERTTQWYPDKKKRVYCVIKHSHVSGNSFRFLKI